MTDASPPSIQRPGRPQELTERQAMVLRALVSAYVGQAGPVGSKTLTHLTPARLSAASIRNTLAQLHEMGLIDKAHASAGRSPTPLGLQVFVDELLDLADLGPHQRRLLDRALADVDAAETPRQASHLLSEHTRQLGFVVAPRVERLRLRSLHLVRVSAEQVLAVLVTETGGLIQRTISQSEPLDVRELEQIGAILAERVRGRTLVGLRARLESERRALRGEANELMHRVWALGLGACDGESTTPHEDLVIATRLTLLSQPEFADPERIRGLFAALETNARLLELLRQIGSGAGGRGGEDEDDPTGIRARSESGREGRVRRGERIGLAISLGAELGEPALRDCALIAVPYGTRTTRDSLGVLGVIGPQRMDYGRVIPLVRYCSELVTRKLLS